PFLPALARAAAYTEPDAPAPTMTTSTCSRLAISPPLLRRNVRHVWDAEGGVTFHCSVDHIDSVAARHRIDQRPRRTLPAVDHRLPHQVDKIVLLGRVQLREPQAVMGLRGSVYTADGGPIKIHEGRLDVENACL